MKDLFRRGGDSDDVKFLRSEYNYGAVPSLEKVCLSRNCSYTF